MSLWWWMTVTLMLVAAAVLMFSAQRDRPPPHIHRRFREALQQEGINIPARFYRFDLQASMQNLLGRISRSEMDEMQQLLVQAGWGNARTRLYYLMAAWLLPLASGIAGGIYALAEGESLANVILYLLFGFAASFVFMRRFLRWKAQKRQAAIRKEVIPLLHLLRMLFEAGLSLEHILRVIEQQGRDLIPNLARELRLVLKRIEAGQDRAEALAEMAAPLDVPELNDTIAMLKQVTRYGGNIRDSLEEYTELVEQRQVSELREYVSKLSAKMTIVMIVFLFPALMIFLAGPGFLGLAKALKGVGG
ncbi:hypothetical protein MTYP_01683 [Methylophilaceae bacterium]|nr:hypothetical protein MTYP_01683 [Methylophilaceae bacterium]